MCAHLIRDRDVKSLGTAVNKVKMANRTVRLAPQNVVQRICAVSTLSIRLSRWSVSLSKLSVRLSSDQSVFLAPSLGCLWCRFSCSQCQSDRLFLLCFGNLRDLCACTRCAGYAPDWLEPMSSCQKCPPLLFIRLTWPIIQPAWPSSLSV